MRRTVKFQRRNSTGWNQVPQITAKAQVEKEGTAPAPSDIGNPAHSYFFRRTLPTPRPQALHSYSR